MIKIKFLILIFLFCAGTVSCLQQKAKEKSVKSNLLEKKEPDPLQNMEGFYFKNPTSLSLNLIKDSFSKKTVLLSCDKKLKIVSNEHAFYFCRDSVKSRLKQFISDNSKTNDLDTLVFLCKALRFNIINQKTKTRVKLIHYV